MLDFGESLPMGFREIEINENSTQEAHAAERGEDYRDTEAFEGEGKSF